MKDNKFSPLKKKKKGTGVVFFRLFTLFETLR